MIIKGEDIELRVRERKTRRLCLYTPSFCAVVVAVRGGRGSVHRHDDQQTFQHRSVAGTTCPGSQANHYYYEQQQKSREKKKQTPLKDQKRDDGQNRATRRQGKRNHNHNQNLYSTSFRLL